MKEVTLLVKKIWSIVTTTVVVIMVLLATLLAGARLLGLQVYTVITGSMEPNYPVGSIIYVKEVDPTTLKEKDVITFMLSENTIATHRIVEVIPDEKNPEYVRFRTKGDNNDIVDTSLVHSNNVLGKVVAMIPYLGYVSDFVQHPPGSHITMAAAAVMIVAVFLPDLIKSAKSDGEEEPSAGETSDENKKLKAEIESLRAKIQETADTSPMEDNGGNDHENI